MQEKNETRKVRVIIASVAFISGLYYLATFSEPLYQELSKRSIYLPIFLGGLWFGLRGGIRISLIVTPICLRMCSQGWGRMVLPTSELEQ